MLGLLDRLGALFGGRTQKEEGPAPSLGSIGKNSSLARSQRTSSISLTYFEHILRAAVTKFVQGREGAVKHTHGFAAFWLQFGKLEEGFQAIQTLLEENTGSKLGNLKTELLLTRADKFGLDPTSPMLQQIVHAAPTQNFEHIDFVGLITALLAIHLSEPAGIRGMNPHVLTMLGCLEHAFAHFESAKRGRLDRREVETALLEESSKVATRDGKHAATKTGHRLASKLFKSIEWSNDNTISFEAFLRGIVTMVSEEYGEL